MASNARTVRRLIGVLILLLAGAAVVASFRSAAAWQWLVENEQRLRDALVHQHPIAGFFTGLVAFTLISLVPFLAGKSLVVAWLFGFWRSLAIVNIGLTLAALLEFFITRYLLRDAIQSKFGFRLVKVNEALERDGAFYLFSARVAHVPYTLTNYLMGATSMRALPFWYATQLGLLPSNILYCYAGDKLPTLQQVATHGLSELWNLEVVIAFLLLAIAPWIAKAVIKKLKNTGASRAEAGRVSNPNV